LVLQQGTFDAIPNNLFDAIDFEAFLAMGSPHVKTKIIDHAEVFLLTLAATSMITSDTLYVP
jgi:hypothetical protein